MFKEELKENVDKKVVATFSNMDFDSVPGLCQRFGLTFASL